MEKSKIIKKYDRKINELREEGNIEDSLILELAKTALWLTKCAEYYKRKIAETENLEDKEKYLKLVHTFYDLKLRIVKLLLKTDKVKIGFFRPKLRHRLNNLEMCEEHQKAYSESGITNLVTFLYQNYNFNDIYHCKECKYDLVKGYYCLYHLAISVDDISLKLNIPYVLLKDEEQVKKQLRADWVAKKEGIYCNDKNIVDRTQILDEVTFSKDKLKQNFKELKEILDNKETAIDECKSITKKE